jgi:NADPH-dependent curcumin reductase CurA
MVVCLAKRAGVKVIGSAGSDAKVAYLRDELKVDVAFNYKKESTREVLAANPFEMYWDNVGGKRGIARQVAKAGFDESPLAGATLEAVFDTIKEFGRIVACGAISEYNTKNPYGVKNTFNVFAKSLLFQG